MTYKDARIPWAEVEALQNALEAIPEPGSEKREDGK